MTGNTSDIYQVIICHIHAMPCYYIWDRNTQSVDDNLFMIYDRELTLYTQVLSKSNTFWWLVYSLGS